MATDADLMFRVAADGNLTADEAETTPTILDLGQGGTGINGMTAWLLVPTDSGTDTLQVTLFFDDTAAMSSTNESFTFDLITGGTSTFPYYKEYHFVTTRRYCSMKFDVTDTGGGVNFGAVQAGIKLGGALSRGVRP